MTWFVLLLPLLIVVFIGAMLLLLPSVATPTVPLGVSIPRGRIDEPSIAAAVRHYRWGVGGAVVVSVAVTVSLAAAAPVAAVIVPVLLVLVLSVSAYVISRRRIQRAKHDGGWYEDVPVRLTAGISASDYERVTTPLGWHVAALVVLAAAAGLGAGVYPGLPDPIPVHWNASGMPDAYAAKSAATVFGSLLTGVGLVVFLAVTALLTREIPQGRATADVPGWASAGQSRRRLMQSFLGQITLAMAVLFAGISVATWFRPGAAMPVLTVGFLAVTFALIALLMIRLRAVTRDAEAASTGTAAPRTDIPDDDRYWKGGLVYVNRHDPALFVPKRFGVGWTVNAGHPAGMAIVVALVLFIVGVAVFVPGGTHPGTSR